MSNCYEIRFYTTKYADYSWVIQLFAENAEDAKEIVVQRWANDSLYGRFHQFGLSVRPFTFKGQLQYPEFTVFATGRHTF